MSTAIIQGGGIIQSGSPTTATFDPTAPGPIGGTTPNTVAATRFFGADGTVASPTYTWTSDTASGWYRIGSNQYGFSIAGSNVATFGQFSAAFNAINTTPIGAATPSTGSFTTVMASGLVTANGGVTSTNLISSTNVRSSSNSGIFSIGSANDAAIQRIAAGSILFTDNTGTARAAITAGTVTFSALTDSGKAIAGATGAITQNATTGQVQFAAAATSLVVTNSLVTANSIIVATVGTADLNLKSVVAVAAAGSFTLTANSAPGATTKVNYHVTN